MTRRRPFIPATSELVYDAPSPRATVLWQVLDDLCRDAPATTATRSQLGRLLGCSPRTVHRAVVELVDAGWLHVDAGRGRGVGSTYQPLRRARPQAVGNAVENVPRVARFSDLNRATGDTFSGLHTSYRAGEKGQEADSSTGPVHNRPRWCRRCREDTRLLEVGDRVSRCPACHPLTVPAF